MTPSPASVTSVTLEHTGIIGETVEEIATDKAHVAPENAPLVTGATGKPSMRFGDRRATLSVVGDGKSDDVQAIYEGRTNHTEAAISLSGPDWNVETSIPLLGEYQAQNAGIAAVLARQVADVTEADLARGLRKGYWPGRFEVMGSDPLVALDGAHNPGACDALADTIAEFDYDDLHFVFGAMHDKDIGGWRTRFRRRTTSSPPTPNIDRAEDVGVVARVFEDRGVEHVERVTLGRKRARRYARGGGRGRFRPRRGVAVRRGGGADPWTRAEIPKRIADVDDARDALNASHVGHTESVRTRGKAVHRVVKTSRPDPAGTASQGGDGGPRRRVCPLPDSRNGTTRTSTCC